jgi:hypothetical protein
MASRERRDAELPCNSQLSLHYESHPFRRLSGMVEARARITGRSLAEEEIGKTDARCATLLKRRSGGQSPRKGARCGQGVASRMLGPRNRPKADVAHAIGGYPRPVVRKSRRVMGRAARGAQGRETRAGRRRLSRPERNRGAVDDLVAAESSAGESARRGVRQAF